MKNFTTDRQTARPIRVDAFWDPEAEVWCASCDDIYGVAIDDKTRAELVARLKYIIPEMLELNHADALAAAKDGVGEINGVRLNLTKFSIAYRDERAFELRMNQNAEVLHAQA